nr:MAG TPA: hypothetical protein [Caudoviricetes sp.]
MNINSKNLYDIDCEVRLELGMEIIPRDCFHGDFELDNKNVDTIKAEWKEFLLYRQNILNRKGEI